MISATGTIACAKKTGAAASVERRGAHQGKLAAVTRARQRQLHTHAHSQVKKNQHLLLHLLMLVISMNVSAVCCLYCCLPGRNLVSNRSSALRHCAICSAKGCSRSAMLVLSSLCAHACTCFFNFMSQVVFAMWAQLALDSAR